MAVSPAATAGKSSGARPTSLYDAPPHSSPTQALSWTRIASGAAGSSFTISVSLRADIVIEPGLATLAGTDTRTPTSRSVAVNRTVSP